MIYPPSSPKPLTFTQAAEGFVARKLAEWVGAIKGSPMEPAALEYARRESWIMPNEDLGAVTALNLCPQVDIQEMLAGMHNMDWSELEAKKRIAAAVQAGINEANAGIAAIDGRRFKASQEPIPATLGPDAKDGSREVPQTPLLPSGGTAKGIPEACASIVTRLHVFEVGGVELYTGDRALMEYIQAAQVQKRNVVVEWVVGEHGNRALRADLRD